MKRSYQLDPVRVAQARQAIPGANSTAERFRAMTQTELAEKLGVHRITLTQIENGKANASLDLLERLVQATGKSREWLLGEPEQLDPVEESRQQVGAALAKIAAGFEQLTDVLDEQLREVVRSKVAA